MARGRRLLRCAGPVPLGALLLLGAVTTGQAEPTEPAEPREAALIIDDVGDDRRAGLRSIDLPAEVTISVLPHTPHGRDLAEHADARGREVMLHLPMEAKSGADPGPGALYLDMTEQQVRETIDEALAAVPHARGVNNHMGSLITRHPGHMGWLMEELAERDGLYFIDSRTSARSVARRMAREHGVPHAERKVFLDPRRDPELIEAQFERFVSRAQERSGVIAIGHPYPETLELLEEELPDLEQRGVAIVAAGEVVEDAGDEAYLAEEYER